MLEKFRSQLVSKGPSLMRLPLKMTPFAIQRQVLEQLLKWQFHESLIDGELDFLENKWLKVEITDLQLVWFISLQNSQLMVRPQGTADVSISGNANELILIAARKEDPDSLFFQRRLVIEGDTELGLYVKNLMDAFELEKMPAPLRFGLMQLAEFIQQNKPQEGSAATQNSTGLISC
ncbi:SCP2 domain-containing protein [Moellerella wisconsensis]|uniref:ubiquinone anaerobic biosynthesis accessory factor UbiT n=1 Tax=Moellerella wisconsensis TaxID=158849 RepID=UPI00307677B6